MSNVMTDLNEALKQAKLAYQFTPSSYTYHVMSTLFTARARLDHPIWIEEVLDWNNRS